MALVPNSSVTIEGEDFSLVTIPDAKSELVKREKEAILGVLDLESLVAYLDKLGSLIRIAYNGVAGNTELQIKVQQVAYKITELADKSAITVHKFKRTSNSVLQALQGTYMFLLDGLEEMALENLSMLSKVAKKMAKEAIYLKVGFEAAKIDVLEILKNTKRTKREIVERKENLKKKQQKLELDKQEAQQRQNDAKEAEEKAESLYEMAQKREDEALDKQSSLLRALMDTVIKAFNAAALAATFRPAKAFKELNKIGDCDNTAFKQAMQNANAEKMKHIEYMQKQQDEKRKANQEFIEFTERIKNCKNDESLEDEVIDSLHNSIGALQSLSVIMMNASIFWQQMQVQCEYLAKKDIQRQIEKAMKYPDSEKRLKTWTSKPFKIMCITYYCQWVALDDVCGSYMAQIKKTREDLYKQIQENPTIEESRKNVRRLAGELAERVKKEQDIADKETHACSKSGDEVAFTV